MAKAPACLLASTRGRNPTPEAAALEQECLAALSIWAVLPPGSAKRARVCRQLIELRGRLDAAAAIAEEVRHA